MNVDSVETFNDTAFVTSDGADVILGKNGKEATWGVYDFPVDTNWGREGFNYNNVPPTSSGTISSAWDIADRNIKKRAAAGDGTESIEDATESVVLLRDRISTFQFLRNDSQWQRSSQNDADGKFIEATYKTTIGGDTSLQGTENMDACGEAWWFFKLSEDNREGYAICIDNHGYGGCGVFERFWNQMYVCHYDWNNPITRHVEESDNKNGDAAGVPHPGSAANVTILKKWRVSPLQVSPRYEVTVHEKDGVAAITVDPDELNAPYSYIGRDDNSDAWGHNGYYTGYLKGSEHTDASNNSYLNGIQEGGNNGDFNTEGTANNIAREHYRNKDNYDWDWPGASQDPVTTTVKLSQSIMDANTTQAFSAYNWNGTYFANNSVDVKRMVSKSFGNIVEEPAWTEGALHMLINIDSEADSTMLVGADAGRREMAGSHR